MRKRQIKRKMYLGRKGWFEAYFRVNKFGVKKYPLVNVVNAMVLISKNKTFVSRVIVCKHIRKSCFANIIAGLPDGWEVMYG